MSERITVDTTSTLYMDGSAIYNFRIKDRAGIIATVRMWLEDVNRLVEAGIAEWR